MAFIKLTDKQELIFDFIKETIRDSGYPPTVREIGDRFEITVKGAYDHVKAIEKKGFIKTEKNKSRAIIVIGCDGEMSNPDLVQVPLVGQIAAGVPILAEENVEDYLKFPAGMFGKGDFFALKVKGDSMIEGGIFDGDIAIIQKQETANNNDIVAALVDGEEATLKRFKKEKNAIHLIPENSEYSPIVSQNVSVLGKLAAVFRRY